jgi:hypothetical protein
LADWLHFFEALLWPTIVLVIVLIFKSPMKALIDRIENAEIEVPGGTKIKLALLKRNAENLIPQLVPSTEVRDVVAAPVMNALEASSDSQDARKRTVGQITDEVTGALIAYLKAAGSGAAAVQGLTLSGLVGVATASSELDETVVEALQVFSSMAEEFAGVPDAMRDDDAYIAFATIGKAIIARLNGATAGTS